MNRRIAIRNLALVLGGAMLFPAELVAGVKNLITLKNIKVTPDQERLLADIAETIIPKTSTPGAKDLTLHLFVLTMVDDCYNKTDQDNFIKGLVQFNELSVNRNAGAFSVWPVADREAFLLSIEQANTYPTELNRFYKIVKDKTVQGYTQSQFFMTKEIVYELVPGRYIVNVPVKSAVKTTGK
ncbi:gluconate 2-dehydrogenase subunit 3 family protein [Mucilaginibacter hurinus]|uniref:Gluconate 2-dehydrogenase subunit 3 family protein n=1 Tax=Mucilaginibacter hurinus TaxID=2201324 RepID=A0A367GPF6_9SPHI|nr:gluconate 2-dehydrogenase subunit 3 family protein [Mucilaginibacter hurinus]RCH55372.1 gluconate 2-dehydrogenase subunit 3 family protein [Mucilaginibacter hurinus]